MKMRSRLLGRTGLLVSEIGFGAWAIGGSSGVPAGIRAYGETDDATSLAALRRAVEVGITFFDTADVYGLGRSEELVGKALSGVRERVVIATKAGWNFVDQPLARYDFSPTHLRRACEASLRRLHTDVIDIFQFHNPTLEVLRQGEAVTTARTLQREGKVRWVGVSIKTAEEVEAAIELGVDSIQLRYSYLEREHEGASLERARQAGVGIIVREPLARGLLAGRYTQASRFGAADVRAQMATADWNRRMALVEEFKALVRPDVPLGRAALKFVLAQPAVTVAIPGAKTAAQVEENAAASDGAYDLARDVFEGEGGDA